MPDEFTPPRPAGGTYPLPESERDDLRLSLDLVVDVAEVLERYDYPRLGRLDLMDLQEALYRFLYRE